MNYFGHFVLVTNVGGGDVTYIFPAADVKITATPRVFGGEGVVELVSGVRVEAPREAKVHVDVEIRWSELGEADWVRLHNMMRSLLQSGSGATKVFYPRANATRTGPLGGDTGVSVVIDHKGGTYWTQAFEGRTRMRRAELTLKGAALLDVATLPAWLLI